MNNNRNGPNHQLPDGQEIVEDQEDDDFGEFEGFEGGVERRQAQAAPSPWAIPDLLPVPPAADEGPSRNGALNNPPQWDVPGPSRDEGPRPMPQQMRTLNPPDVSLGTNQAAGGRVTPDNVHDAALAVVMDHLDNSQDNARHSLAQMDRLSQQLESAEQSRAQMEQLLNRCRLRNHELELQLQEQAVNSQEQINELGNRLQGKQEVIEQQLLEMRNMNADNWRNDFKLIQDEFAALRQSQMQSAGEAGALQNTQELRTEISNQLHTLESGIQRNMLDLEQRFSTRLDEQSAQMQAAVERILQQTVQQIAGNLTQVVQEASNCGTNTGGLLQSIQSELQKHKEEQKKALENERRRQLDTLASALQLALQQLNNAIHDEQPQSKKDHS